MFQRYVLSSYALTCALLTVATRPLATSETQTCFPRVPGALSLLLLCPRVASTGNPDKGKSFTIKGNPLL